MGLADVVIVGAGVGGTTAAHALGQRGFSVVLIDAKHPCPPCFKAEKMWPGNLAIFGKLGLKDAALSVATEIRQVVEARAGRMLSRLTTGEHGMYYQDLVNALRSGLPPSVVLRVSRVTDVQSGPEEQQVTLSGGEHLHGRIVVIASGYSGSLGSQIGLVRRMIREGQSTGFGFDVARADGAPFPFDALTYLASGVAARAGYVTFFPVGGVMRANLFVFRSAKDPWVRGMLKEPHEALCDAFKGIERVLGAFVIAGKIETAGVDLWRVENASELDGVVVVGDAFQSACPSTGTGLDKVLSDVDVLCSRHLPTWLATKGMSRDKIRSFYSDPRKLEVDRYSLRKARYERWAATSPTWWAALHRARVASQMYLSVARPARWIWADRTYVSLPP